MYQNLFGHCLGLKTVAEGNFASVLHELHPHVEALFDAQIALALADMEQLDDAAPGSKKRAVTTADGCWLPRGAFSKNATVHVRNYITNKVLAYKHICQRPL